MLYEVALIQKPTKKGEEEGDKEKLILKPTPVIAESPQSAAVAAVMEHKGEITCDMARVEVLVRPFGS